MLPPAGMSPGGDDEVIAEEEALPDCLPGDHDDQDGVDDDGDWDAADEMAPPYHSPVPKCTSIPQNSFKNFCTLYKP